MRILRTCACVAALVAGTVGSVSTAAAKSVLYDCDITQRNANVGWVSPKLALFLGADGNAKAIDSVILNFVGTPLDARVTQRGDKLNFAWRLKGARDSNNLRIATFSYRATIDKKTNAVLLTANPSGYSEQWSGRGTCTPRTDAKLPKGLR